MRTEMAPMPAKRPGTAQASITVTGKPLIEGDFPRLFVTHGNHGIFMAGEPPAHKGKRQGGNAGDAKQFHKHILTPKNVSYNPQTSKPGANIGTGNMGVNKKMEGKKKDYFRAQ